MQKTIVGLFTSEESARTAIATLRDRGYTENEINLIHKGRGSDGETSTSSLGMTNSTDEDDFDMGVGDVSAGLASGATWGGLAGLALGAGALAIPGAAPLVAAGPIAAALTGAATGGIAGGLIDWGIPEERGRHYEDRVSKGELLTIIKVSENRANEAAGILRDNAAKDVEVHSSKR